MPDRPINGPYQDDVHQHEVMITLAWIAALTSRVALQTNVLVLPQRQPVLVAKQAAEIDILSGGRFRLGIGIGWQVPEFESLGVPFRQRPSRMEEAIHVLRACWTEEPVNFEGRYTTIREMSVMPKPVTPGGPPGSSAATPTWRWIARLGSATAGSPSVQSDTEQLIAATTKIRAALELHGRSSDEFPLQWLPPLDTDMASTRRTLTAARDAGFTRIGIGMPNYDREAAVPVDEYLRHIETTWREVWPELRG